MDLFHILSVPVITHLYMNARRCYDTTKLKVQSPLFIPFMKFFVKLKLQTTMDGQTGMR